MGPFDYIIGFDFGHGETSAAIVDVSKITPREGTIPVEDLSICQHSHEPKITSLVGYAPDGKTEVDIDVYDFSLFDHIEAYFKGPVIGNKQFPAISPEQKAYFKDFVKTVFARLTSNPRNTMLVGHDVGYYAACPSGWSDAQINAYHKFLVEECGLPIVAVVQESRAAHVSARKKIQEKDSELAQKAKRIVVLDLGSSTLDITLHADRTYTDGYRIGASKIEEILLDHFLESDEDFKSDYNSYLKLNANGRDEILLLLRYAKEEYFNKQKKYPDRDIAFSCSIDWENLSQDMIEGTSKLRISGKDLIELIQRADADREVSYGEELKNSILKFIEKYGKADVVVLTGGASQMFFYKDLVLECFDLEDNACIVDGNPSYSISQGVAMIGYMDYKLQSLIGGYGQYPKELEKLLKSIKPLISSTILENYKEAYTKSFCSIVDTWKNKPGVKTFRNLALSLDNLINDWDKKSKIISDEINRSVGKKVSDSINSALSEIIRLYFGFDAKIDQFSVDYYFGFSISNELTKSLFRGAILQMADYIQSRPLGVWHEPSSLDKDRADDAELMAEFPVLLKNYATNWFATLKVEDAIDEEVTDCQEKLKEFYNTTTRKITCQI